MNKQILSCHNPTQLNPKLGRPYFPKINHNQLDDACKKKLSLPQVATTQLNSTQPNSFSLTEQEKVLFNPNQIQYKTKTIQPVVAQLWVT